ncbi:condensation domain-containing protein [Nonomuraea longicatena]|uniref:Carrier domain-containing protein n=1 Tax=Nonomuraea longicatena TaxID=83682 RepID=A0ABN1PJY3_9ACTN
MLSSAQERLWFLHRLDSHDPSHNRCYSHRLRGTLDPARLSAAFARIEARHPALRTRYPDNGRGVPEAVVEPPGRLTVERLRAAGVEEAARLAACRTNTAFNLAQAPPFRVSLIELAPDDHVLVVVVHLISADEWSLRVLREEVAACYAGEPPPVPAPRPEPRRDPDLTWWTERLSGTPALDLATDRPRPAVRGTAGGEVRFDLPPALVAAVAERARTAGCTPFTVLFAAYQLLLSAHSGQFDFCVGLPSAGRGAPELERAIGCLSTTTVLRCDLSGDPDFSEVLRRTRENVRETLARPDAPVDRLIAALRLERDLSRTPLFQSLFALHTHRDAADPLPGLAAEPFAHGWHPARHDLTLDLHPKDDGGLLGVMIYSEELFDRETAERMAAQYVSLLTTGEPLTDTEPERKDTAAQPPGHTDADLVPTPGGRPALPRPRAAAGYVAPRGAVEALVAEVYGEVLDRERVGALDDFFALGGHSLSAVRVVSRLRAAVEVEVPVRALFTGPTVEAVARVVEELLVAELGRLSDEGAERLARELT